MARNATKVLLVDDDRSFRRVTEMFLVEAGLDVRVAANGRDGLEALEAYTPDLLLTDLKMPVMDGYQLLEELSKRGVDIPVVVLTAYGSIESAVRAMREGALNYVTKPINRAELLLAIERATEVGCLRKENRRLRAETLGQRASDRLLGHTDVMVELRATLCRLAISDAPALITGESGVGKELAARALHFDGPRARRGKFVVVNCAAVPNELLESMLFGHRRGAFTGAEHDKRGRFELADGGTLFLDEIGDLAVHLQGKLLRALQEGEIDRLGDTEVRRVDVRVVSATNQDLALKIESGEFRRDLYYRLATLPINVPPLRARREDIPMLIKHFLARYGSPDAKIPPTTLEDLRGRSWHGNVRELESTIMRACALAPSMRSLTGELVRPIEPAGEIRRGTQDHFRFELPDEGLCFEEVEKSLLEAAWQRSGFNQTRGAELLGLARQAFSYRLQKHGIIPRHSRGSKRGRHKSSPDRSSK